jgi:hypothetical protein
VSDKITVRRRSGFSAIPNAVIRDVSISAEARLMLCYIMSCNEDWVFYRNQSMKILGCKKDKYQRIVRELKVAGYLIVRPKRKADGRVDGWEWEVFDEPHSQDVGEQGENTPQDVAPGTPDREPEKPAHGEAAHRGPEKPARRLNPPAGKTGPFKRTTKEEDQQTSCAADAPHDFDLDLFLEEFLQAHPRPGSMAATRKALEAALGEGADPQEILAGAQAYAEEQEGNEARFIKLSDGWLREKRWAQFSHQAAKPVDRRQILEARAKEIIEGKPWVRSTISLATARECIAEGLVTAEQCKAAGLDV